MLFHLGVLDTPALPPPGRCRSSSAWPKSPSRFADAFVAYLHRKSATCKTKTVSSLATRLAGFGRFLAETDPNLDSLAELDRRRHIEPFLTSLTGATNTRHRRADHRRRSGPTRACGGEFPGRDHRMGLGRRAAAAAGVPLRPTTAARPLPRYLPVDADRRLTEELAESHLPAGRRRAAAATRLRAAHR